MMTLLALAYGLVQPSYMEPYRSPVGQFIMAMLALLFTGVLLWVRKMSQPEPAPRFLNTPGQHIAEHHVPSQWTESPR